ncbi:flagellar biosynthetic protein FliO [Nitrospinaceae bacterium]|nr:flagellar biosynthetic protein FliO [Nitrospinaceae bacterium]
MKLFLKLLTISQLFILIFANLAGASNQPEAKWGSLNLLKKVHSHLMSNGHIVRLEFKNPVENWAEPVFYEKSVQLDFPGAFIEPAKKSFSADSSMVTKVFASQFDGETLRVRFHIKPGTDDIEERFKLVSQGRFIIVRFDTDYVEPVIASSKAVSQKTQNTDVMGDKELADFLSRASEKMKRQEEILASAVKKEEPTIQEVETQSSEIKVKRAGMGVAPLVDQIKKAALSNSDEDKKDVVLNKSKTKITTKGNTSFSLKDSRPTGKPMEMIPSGMKMISMFAVVLGLMFLIFFGFKKYVLKNTAFGGGNKLVNVLGTWFLGPKKNIALVEVAGEILVLGMSQDNITLLSSIIDEEKIEEIKNTSGKGKSGLGWKTAPVGEKSTRSVATQAAAQFSSYLSKYSSSKEAKNQTVADAKDQILQKIGKFKTARA